MAELSTVARPYAEAIFKLAQDKASSSRWADTLNLLDVVVRDARIQALIGNPRVQTGQLLALIADIGGEHLDEEAHQFLAVLAENDRLTLLPLIREQFDALRHEREGVLDAHVRSAFALSDAQLASLVRDLEARFKHGIRPDVRIDPSLIGGVLVSVGDVVIDGSVRGRLDRMEAALKS